MQIYDAKLKTGFSPIPTNVSTTTTTTTITTSTITTSTITTNLIEGK